MTGRIDTWEVVNLDRGALFLTQEHHLARPDRSQQCEQIVASVSKAQALSLDDRRSMGLNPLWDYRVVPSTACLSAGIGVFLNEETRVYGSVYLRATTQLRSALFGDTALAWDIISAYPSFMRMISKRCLPRLEETKAEKDMVRWMVAAAYGLQPESAKKLMHAMTNGKSLRKWKGEAGVPEVTSQVLQTATARLHTEAGDALAEKIKAHHLWEARDGELEWLLEYQAQVLQAIDDVHDFPALRDVRKSRDSSSS